MKYGTNPIQRNPHAGPTPFAQLRAIVLQHALNIGPGDAGSFCEDREQGTTVPVHSCMIPLYGITTRVQVFAG